MSNKKYLNLDKNQLADKGKTKLQYEENCKEAAKRYSESKKHENGCKTSKGVIGNISKKILMGSIVFVLSTTSLTGCKAYGFKYEKNNEGIRYATGTVDSNYIEDCYYLEISYPNYEHIEKYLTVKENSYDEIKYFDVFTLDTIYIEGNEDYKNIDVVNIISVDEYLDKNNAKEDKYSVEYMEELLEMLENESIKNNKQLIK